jgi:hypothetical protein
VRLGWITLVNVRVDWFKIAIRIFWMYWGVQGCVAPEEWKTGGGSVIRCRGRGPQKWGESCTAARQRG